MVDDSALVWNSPAPRVQTPPRKDGPVPEPAAGRPARPAADRVRWVTLRQAHEQTGVSMDRLRSWARKGRVPTRLGEAGDGSPRRMVGLDEVRERVERLDPARTPRSGRTVVDLRDELDPVVARIPDGAMLVPLEAWERMMMQLGNLHEAGQQLAEARERAAKAETEAAFLRERLAETRVTSPVGPGPPAESAADPPRQPATSGPEPAFVPRLRQVYRRWRERRL